MEVPLGFGGTHVEYHAVGWEEDVAVFFGGGSVVEAVVVY